MKYNTYLCNVLILIKLMKNIKEDITPRNVNGERHGEWIEYWNNGQLFYKGTYINGNKIGMWKEWNWNTNEYDNIFYG